MAGVIWAGNLEKEVSKSRDGTGVKAMLTSRFTQVQGESQNTSTSSVYSWGPTFFSLN
jgi:hypothetical protein